MQTISDLQAQLEEAKKQAAAKPAAAGGADAAELEALLEELEGKLTESEELASRQKAEADAELAKVRSELAAALAGGAKGTDASALEQEMEEVGRPDLVVRPRSTCSTSWSDIGALVGIRGGEATLPLPLRLPTQLLGELDQAKAELEAAQAAADASRKEAEELRRKNKELREEGRAREKEIARLEAQATQGRPETDEQLQELELALKDKEEARGAGPAVRWPACAQDPQRPSPPPLLGAGDS